MWNLECVSSPMPGLLDWGRRLAEPQPTTASWLCFDFWLGYEVAAFDVKWDAGLPPPRNQTEYTHLRLTRKYM